MARKIHWWKLVGLAGLAGVVATGALVARDERARRHYTPDEVRDRLHARHAEAERAQSEAEEGKEREVSRP